MRVPPWSTTFTSDFLSFGADARLLRQPWPLQRAARKSFHPSAAINSSRPQASGTSSPQPPPLRAQRLSHLSEEVYDVLVIGGGITGCGVALDLVARGLSVALVERGDWASATSSASSRLIHGGLRYLEHFEFGLVRESCLERGLLLNNAAGLVWPERFVYPVRRGASVGRLKLAAGLGLYSLLSLPRPLGLPRIVSAREVQRRIPGIAVEGLKGGGSYLDGATDDARLCLAVVLTALERGANCVSQVEAVQVKQGSNNVSVSLRNRLEQTDLEAKARAVVLAGGPFTESLRTRSGLSGPWVQPTRGTHILVPREKLPTDGAVILSSSVDGRVLFLIPWTRYTAIGTTDLDANPEDPIRASAVEVRYLLDSANGLVPAARLAPDDVISTWAGLRPLLAAPESDPSARSREERVEREGSIYTIAGGKLTGYRAMAEDLGARLASDLGRGNAAAHSPTRSLRLRGGLERAVGRPAWSSLGPDARPATDRETIHYAWSMRYGALASAVMEYCQRQEQGQSALDSETLLGEVDWAVRFEDALSVDDFILRRTDLGLGPRGVALDCIGAVAQRMAQRLGWSHRRQGEQEDLARLRIQDLHAWTGES